uniref:methylmalonic aciduria and homocystinuria type C protein homolog n=1 Tax=Ciona intestinalis TaxID=7719 RepID=UPI0002B8E452|nr:methylmalonic aciduria and homocystinuria type C protein homolog [Ciona intestinalis]|eukprot:XP_004226045.1 methylmalonic aciduria and homocystinuria type C protein homolog [Ciona intestinalis]
MDTSRTLLKHLNDKLNPLGMEVYLFKVSWYNETVRPCFKLPYADNVICAVVLTVPAFFESAFLPNVENLLAQKQTKDPIDECIAFHLNETVSGLNIGGITIMYDYEILPNRRPKVLVQTAAHVAGAAFYYQREHVLKPSVEFNKLEPSSHCDAAGDRNQNKGHCRDSCNAKEGTSGSIDPWGGKRKIYGVCVHPKYGGWFAIRAVLVFTELEDANLTKLEPTDCVKTRTERIDLLEKFNGNWKDSTYRDVIQVKEKYSELQTLYFLTLPKDRMKLLQQIVNNQTV